MDVRLKKYSFRFSEELFNSRLAQKSEIEQILYAACVDFSKLNRKEFNKILNDLFLERGSIWSCIIFRNRLVKISDGILFKFRPY